MKPTLKCKLNYLRKNYHDSRIPFFSTALRILNLEHLYGNFFETKCYSGFFEEFEKIKEAEIIADFMLDDIKIWSCDNCVNKYICKLTPKNNETYTKM